MPNDHRERQFERALARHLPNAFPESACPDAEVLAAYHERTLSVEEMSQWKEHIATCDRCQEILALVEHTDNLPVAEREWDALQPVETALVAATRAARSSVQAGAQSPSSSPKPSEIGALIGRPGRRAPWRWVVPIGAIAAAIIVVISLREIRTQHSREAGDAQVAENRMNMPQLPVPQTERRDIPKREQTPAAKLDDTTALRKKAAVPPRPALSQDTAAYSRVPAAPPASNSKQTLNKENNMPASVVTGAAGSQPSTSTYMARSRAAEAPTSSTPSVVARAADGNRPTEEKTQPAKPADTVAQTQQIQAEAPLNEISSQLEVTALKNIGGLVQIAAADRRYIVAPGEVHAWRVGDAGKIERTTDRGKTWKPQKSGVTTELTAGSATSDKICWVVGKTGALLLTTDGGKHWKLLSSPISEDLGGVHATDALHASIWNVTNRISYETSDGGETWQQTANE